MKRVLSLILVVFMLLASLTACNAIGDFFGGLFKDKGLEQAQENVKLLYINKAKDTNADFEVVPQVTIGKNVYTIEWSVNVTDGVKVVKTEDGKIMIDVNDKTDVDIPYVLTATIKSPKGKTATQTFEFNVPKFKELTWDEFAATEDDKPVVIKGVVGGIVETSKENDLYLQDENGGYFVYKLAEKPSDLGIKVGMTVRVSGIRDTYYGVYQVSNPQVEILDSTIKTVEPIDITKAFTDAKNLKDESLTRYQSMFVTIKGATVLGQDENDSTYFNFSLAGKKAYVRISSSTSMLTKEGEATFKKNVADHIGYSADITGFVSIYNNNIYIIPLNENAFSNFVVAERTPAEQVAFEKDMLKDKVNTLITEAGTTELVTTPALYKDVKISWSISENDYAKIENGKLVVSLPDEEVKVTLTATLTQGEATDTASYEVTIAAAPTIIPQIVTAPVANTGYKFFLKQGNINQTLYLSGIIESGSYYLPTSTNPAEAVDVGLEPIEGKDGEYYLYFMDGDIKTYIIAYEGTKTDGSKTATLKTSIRKDDSNVWTFNTEHNTPTTKLTIDGKEDTYYIGSYNQFQTFSLSKISYLPSKTSFAAQFATLLDTSLVSDADKVATEKEALDIPTEYKKNGEFELPIFGSTYTQVEISWESNSEFAVVEGNILKVTQQKAAQTVILTATFTSGEVTETKEITVTITAIPTTVPQVVETPVAGTEYYFALYQNNLKSLLFFTGKMSGYYYGVTDDIDAAVKVVLEAVEGKENTFYLTTTVEGAKKYLNVIRGLGDDGNMHDNVKIEDAAVTEYTYNTELKTLVTTIEEDTFFFGTYDQKQDIRASKIKYADTNFIAHFYELVDTSTISDADKVAQEKDALVGPDNKYTEGATVTLPTAGKNFEDVTITWAVESEFAVIENGVLTITIPETETKVTITATIACGEATETVTFEVTLVKPADPDQPLTYEDYIAAQKGDALSKLTGVVTGIVSKSLGSSYNCLFVQDANGGAYYVYKMGQDPIADLKIEIGMTISVAGGKKDIYNNTHEIVAGDNGLTVTIVSSEKTPVAPVDYTEIFKNATNMKDEALVGKQSLLVTIKGVIITDQNLSNGYLNFKLDGKDCYLRISSSTLGFNTADKDAFIAAHAAKKGYSADVTGIISQYNGAFYLVPVSTDAFVYGELVEQPEDPENPENPENPEIPATLAEQIAAAKKLANGAYLPYETTMTGTVVGTLQESSYTAGSWKLNLTDGTNTITLYFVPVTGTPTEGCTITVTGKLTAYNGSAQFDSTATAKVEGGSSNPETPVDPENPENPETPEINYGTSETPVTVTDAFNASKNLASSEVSAEAFYVKGTVTKIGSTGSYYKEVYFTDGTTEMLIYTISLSDGITGFKVGDTIVANGYIKNYNGTIEMASNGSTYVYVVSVEPGTTENPETPENPENPDTETKYSYTFEDKVFSANGTKELGNLSWTLAGEAGNFWGFDSQNGRGQQFGSSSAPYTSMTFTSAAVNGVTKIVINTSGASQTNATLTVTVGGTKIGETISLTNKAAEYTFTSTTALSGEVVLTYTQTSSKAIYIKSIAINDGESDTPVEPENPEIPATLAEQIAAAKKLANGAYLPYETTMTGTVVAGSIVASTKVEGTWKLDLTDGTNTITLYYVPVTGTPTEGCTITVTGKLTAYNGSAQFDSTATAKVEGGSSNPETPVEPENPEIPATLAEQIAAAKKLANGAYLPYETTMTGTVVGTLQESSYTAGTWKLDLTDGTNTITLYYVPVTGTPTEGCTITVTGKLTAYNGNAQFDKNATAKVEGGSSNPETPVEPETPTTPDADGKITYTFANYEAGVQYAANEEHKLDDKVTVTTNDAHFTTEIRLYKNDAGKNEASGVEWDARNGTAVFALSSAAKSLSINAGNKANPFEVYGSTNGTDWVLITTITATSTYTDYEITLNSTEYTYIKLAATQAQVRIASVTFGF